MTSWMTTGIARRTLLYEVCPWLMRSKYCDYSGKCVLLVFRDTLSMHMEFTGSCEETGWTTPEVLTRTAIITMTISFHHDLISLLSYFIW